MAKAASPKANGNGMHQRAKGQDVSSKQANGEANGQPAVDDPEVDLGVEKVQERQWGDSWPWIVRWVCGVLLTVNFVILWALPIFGQGQLWKLALQYVGTPIYKFIDNLPIFRKFAVSFIYSKPQYADYFVQAIFVTVSWLAGFALVLHCQLTHGTVYWSYVFAYYCIWVGFGGRVMGGAYTFAHREGHNAMMYKPWIRNTIGNFFENWLGCFFGNVPYNFTTSHIAIHHRLNAEKGDTFYQWDLDRSSWVDLMVYLHRIFLHTMGLSSLMFFHERGQKRHFNKLLYGSVMYWLVVPAALLYITCSWSFVYFIYFQPFLCMTYFLAFMNFGFHGFIEFDEKGNNIWCVNSTTIIEGEDDYFGEDDHMAHHYATQLWYKDLPKYQKEHSPDFHKYRASVFRGLSIVELSMFILLKQWKLLASHYVDYEMPDRPKMTIDEIAAMLEVRAKRKEP